MNSSEFVPNPLKRAQNYLDDSHDSSGGESSGELLSDEIIFSSPTLGWLGNAFNSFFQSSSKKPKADVRKKKQHKEFKFFNSEQEDLQLKKEPKALLKILGTGQLKRLETLKSDVCSDLKIHIFPDAFNYGINVLSYEIDFNLSELKKLEKLELEITSTIFLSGKYDFPNNSPSLKELILVFDCSSTFWKLNNQTHSSKVFTQEYTPGTSSLEFNPLNSFPNLTTLTLEFKNGPNPSNEDLEYSNRILDHFLTYSNSSTLQKLVISNHVGNYFTNIAEKQYGTIVKLNSSVFPNLKTLQVTCPSEIQFINSEEEFIIERMNLAFPFVLKQHHTSGKLEEIRTLFPSNQNQNPFLLNLLRVEHDDLMQIFIKNLSNSVMDDNNLDIVFEYPHFFSEKILARMISCFKTIPIVRNGREESILIKHVLTTTNQ